VDSHGATHGREARKQVKRSSQRDWAPPADRPSPLETLAQQDEGRLPELVPIRYGRMLASPFSFYRGAAAIMAADLGSMPDTGLDVQLCGDAHLSNFGVFAAPDRRLVFDVNDFDETHPGPFEWDVKRLSASLAVAGRENGFDEDKRRSATLASLQQYREAMRDFARMRDLDVWYARLDVELLLQQFRGQGGVTKREAKNVDKGLDKARHKDSLRAFSKLSHEVNGTRRIVSDPPLIVPIEELAAPGVDTEARVRGLMASYHDTLDGYRRRLAERYHYAHAAHKVVGVGSVGNQAWIILLLGRDVDDPLFLQAKEARRSVLEPFCGDSRFEHQGHRVVEGQRLMQAATDIFLGWVSDVQQPDGKRRDFYLRQLWDGKGSADVDAMGPVQLARYARLCGWTLARAHARSGDGAAIAAYLGASDKFDAAVADFAEAYADQNQRDYEVVLAAANRGELEVRSGV
jgi:uncharacterized protein (DUF2252 family)